MSQPRVKVGATPGKLALIGVLAVVMVIVIASNWPASGEPPADETTVASGPAPPPAPTDSEMLAAAERAASAGPFGEFAEDQHWPERPLSEVTKLDPFAKSDWAIPPDAVAKGQEYNEKEINELFASNNAIIFVAGDKRIARIGDQEYQIGDVIGRYKISDISSRGVVLSEAE